MTNVTLSPSPNNPGIEIVDGLTIKRHVPYDAHSVTLQFSPNITHHEPANDQLGVMVRQETVTEYNDETVNHFFDLRGVHKHSVEAMGVLYEVELLNISVGGEFNMPVYDLSVRRVQKTEK